MPSMQRMFDLGAVVSTLAGGLASVIRLGASAVAILRDVAGGVEPSVAVVRQLLEAGVSEGDATDMLLFARHPELGGRKLGTGDEALMAEWRAIRTEVVRPLVRAIEKERAAERSRADGGDDDVGSGDTPPAGPDGSFITDTDRSYLDELPGGAEYRDFRWHRLDFPGAKERVGDTSEANLARLRADPRVVLDPDRKFGPYLKGANQTKADMMFALLARHVPERRANSGAVAVITSAEFAKHAADYDAYIIAQTEAIPGQTDKRLNKHAAASFANMRAAAEADGVALVVKGAFRSRATAKKSAAKADNKAAVASFSSHTLGLAVDLKLQTAATKGDWTDVSTRMDNLTEMYRSPAYKWMAEHASEYGWYPYRREPWHWEHNPSGFRATFFAEAEAALRPSDE
jgi:D-alanyl-D-alanine dipeptidase